MGLRGQQHATVPVLGAVRFLIVSYGAMSCALLAEWVRGVLTLAWNDQAETVAAGGVAYVPTNLEERLGLASCEESSDTRMILYSNGSRHRVFRVERLVELVDVERQVIRPLPLHFRGGEREWVSGLFLHRNIVTVILNPLWVLEANMDDAVSTVTWMPSSAQGPRTGARN